MRRSFTNLSFSLGTVSTETNSSQTGWLSLGVPFSRFHLQGAQSISTGTFAGSLYGGTSSGGTTATTVVLATISNSTASGYNTTAIPCGWLNFVSSGLPSTGGNVVTLSVACAG